MGIGKAFTFIPEDDDWVKKVAVAAAIVFASTLIPLIPMIFLYGYALEVSKNVKSGLDRPLPEWEEWGELFMNGLVVSVAWFVYSIPVMILIACVVFASFATADPNSSWVAVFGLVVLSCLLILLIIGLLFITPALFVQYTRYGEFGPMFQFKEVFSIVRENFVDILLIVITLIFASLVLSLVITILLITICGAILAYLVGYAWLIISAGHLFGQIAAKTDGKVAEVAYAA
jgi:hypothetical protein